jgi:aryl-alcohol dehydrogenase-like predicted oxidoreductase
MTWGQPSGIARFSPARLAYGGTAGPEDEAGAFDVSLAAGVTLFDTAALYSWGASERRLGALAEGHDVVIATKFPPGLYSRANQLPRALEETLARLRRSSVDLYQIHFPSSRLPIAPLMALMADAVEAGKVRAVGVSNYGAGQLREAHAELAKRGIPLASNQVEYSLAHRAPEVDGILDACRELNVTLIAYQPLAMGVLTGKYLTGERPKGMRRFTSYFRPDGMARLRPLVEHLQEIGGRYGVTPAQVALRWLIQREVLPIPGAKNARQAASNAGALSFALTEAEMDSLDHVSSPWKTS